MTDGLERLAYPDADERDTVDPEDDPLPTDVFHADRVTFTSTVDGHLFVESDDPNGLFDSGEWERLRESEWSVLFSNSDGVALIHDD
jgi:hypothetical protein